MLRKLIIVLCCILCPLALAMATILFCAMVPSTDRFTLVAPQFWRSAVSSAIYRRDFPHDPSSHRAMERVVLLDPSHTEAWKRRCLWAGSTGDLQKDVQICQKAVDAEPTFPLVVSALGKAQLAAGDACAAQKTFERAISLDDNPTHYADLDALARAAWRCGDIQQARIAIESAMRIQEENRAGQRMYSGDDDPVARRDEDLDHEFLGRLNQTGQR